MTNYYHYFFFNVTLITICAIRMVKFLNAFTL